MPELSRFEGMIIRMLFSDTGQHSKPHIHVECAEYQASVAIDGEILAGSLPKKKILLLQAWMILHEDELYQAWNNAVQNKVFDRIAPLR